MNAFQKQLREKMEKLARIEKAVFSAKYVHDPALSYDQRLLNILETLVISVGVLQEAHNGLVLHVKFMKKEEQPINELGGE